MTLQFNYEPGQVFGSVLPIICRSLCALVCQGTVQAEPKHLLVLSLALFDKPVKLTGFLLVDLVLLL